MAHNVRIRVIGGWATTTVVTSAEFEAFDAAQAAAINGDAGGSWSPTGPISINGNHGIYSRAMRFGNLTGIGDPTVYAHDDVIDIFGDMIFQRGLRFEGPDPADFVGGINVSTLVVDGTALFEGNTTFNDDVVCNQTFSVDGGDMLLTGLQPISRLPGAATGQCKIGSVAVAGPSGSWSGTFSVGRDPRSVIAKFVIVGGSPDATQKIIVDLHLNPNISHTRLDVQLRGDVSHSSIAGMTVPTLALYRVDAVGGVVLIANATTVPSTNANYVNGFTTPMIFTGFVPSKDHRYILEVTNEGGTNSVGGLQIVSVSWTGNVVSYGNTGEI